MTVDEVRRIIDEVSRPGHFFERQPFTLEWVLVPQEESYWEIFQGRLLDGAQTRQRQTFEAWNIHLHNDTERSAEPMLSIKLDAPTLQLHVVRAILCHGWEAYTTEANVVMSREAEKWVRELVATINLVDFPTLEGLRSELASRLFRAVIGVSRLPLTSLEAPLPAFSLGNFAYLYQPNAEPDAPVMRSSTDLIHRALVREQSWLEKTKLLETVVRATPAIELPETAASFVKRWHAIGHDDNDLLALFRSLFQEVALSPYTDFVNNTLMMLHILAGQGHLSIAQVVDFLSYLLRHVCRHLTAYDLVTFHHRGANYPDALLLDAALKEYLALAGRHPNLFLTTAADSQAEAKEKRLRRRGLRQAWLLRRRYEGHPVPDAPTSPGENARVLPSPHARVQDDQIVNPTKRSKRLFTDPLSEPAHDLLKQCSEDLAHPLELRELGMATFLDRPLSAFKERGHPDQTPLFSYEAFSHSIAETRLKLLMDLKIVNESTFNDYRASLRSERFAPGLRLRPSGHDERPGTVSLDDAFRAADDFVLLRTTRRTANEFRHCFNLFELLANTPKHDPGTSEEPLLLVRSASVTEARKGVLAVYDSRLRQRLELEIDPSLGYIRRGDVELPAAGLRILRAWNETGSVENLAGKVLHPLQPRDSRQPSRPGSQG